MELIPVNEVYCPNCRSDLVLKKGSYFCAKCRAVYPIVNGIHVFLPPRIEPFKKAEQIVWQIHPIEGPKEPAWKALKHKVNDITLFEKIVLPLLRFEGRMLEIGAGSCWASALIKKTNPSLKVYAMDISFHALLKGKGISRTLGSEIDYYIVGDIENMPFRGNLFDVILGKAVLHHLVDPLRGLLEIWRVLRPLCCYIGLEGASSRFFAPFVQRITGANKREQQYGIIENIYSLNDWEKFLAKAGFKDVSIKLVKDYVCWRGYGLAGVCHLAVLNLLPDCLVKRFLPSSLLMITRKVRSSQRQHPSRPILSIRESVAMKNVDLPSNGPQEKVKEET